jgi:predicted MPP superfamily phosphohydrolase
MGHFLTTVVVVVVAALLPILVLAAAKQHREDKTTRLRFGGGGQFKILQVADMHYANGKTTACLDVLPAQMATCSDLNTTAFIQRMIQAEKPNFIVFTGTAFSHFLVLCYCSCL